MAVSADDEGQIFGHFAAQAAREQAGLTGESRRAGWVVRAGVGELFLLALLPGHHHGLAGVAFEQHGAAFAFDKITRRSGRG
jgi:hypothetical protein